MSYLKKVKSSKKSRPRRTVLYGVAGIGKTTWASKWPDPVLLPIEEGADDIDVQSFPMPTGFEGVHLPLMELADGEHKFKTIIIDSADWLEKLIWKKVATNNGKKDISDIPYGKGFQEAAYAMRFTLGLLDDCMKKANMHVVVLAHSSVVRFEDPEGDSYDRYQPKLHKEASASLVEWADEVLFANYKTFTKQTDEGFDKKRSVGIGSGERFIYTQERPAFKAKSRLDLPSEMPLEFDEYSKFLSTVKKVEEVTK